MIANKEIQIMKLQILVLVLWLCISSGSCEDKHLKKDDHHSRESKTEKRGIGHYNMGWGASGVGAYGVPTVPVGGSVGYDRSVPYPVPYDRPVPYPVAYDRPLPYPVHVDRPLPYPVTVDRPLPYPVHVEKPLPYPVHVDRPVPYPVQVEKPMPYPVHVDRPYPVQVDRPMPYPVHVPYKVSVPVDRPYPVHVPIPKPYPVDRPVPYAVQVPVQVPVVQRVPYEVSRPYPVVITKPVMVPQPVAVPQPVLWERSSPYPVYVSTPVQQNVMWGSRPNYIGSRGFGGTPSGYNIGVNHALTALGGGQSGVAQMSMNSGSGGLMGSAYNLMQGLMGQGGSVTSYASGHNNYLGPTATGFTANINK